MQIQVIRSFEERTKIWFPPYSYLQTSVSKPYSLIWFLVLFWCPGSIVVSTRSAPRPLGSLAPRHLPRKSAGIPPVQLSLCARAEPRKYTIFASTWSGGAPPPCSLSPPAVGTPPAELLLRACVALLPPRFSRCCQRISLPYAAVAGFSCARQRSPELSIDYSLR